MNFKISHFAMTFFAFSTIFVGRTESARADDSQNSRVTQVIFKGSEANMGMNLFKFQLKNHLSDLNMSLRHVSEIKFVSVESEVNFDIHGLKPKQIKKRLLREIRRTNNCIVIKQNEPDLINGEVGYRDCLAHSFDAEAIKAANTKTYSSMRERLLAENKLTLFHEEMISNDAVVLETANADSDTISILTKLAADVKDELNFRRPGSSEISVVSPSVGNRN